MFSWSSLINLIQENFPLRIQVRKNALEISS